ncbi:MAG: DNA-directed RNA polymerase subunit delta [Erysipelotrichaceae bacterium]|nr:DNA-directed RNA polymerase subunit delta [Erysipelotrichaceae bacterium]MBQ9987915.1 DNA-directed RNA polymerase subunit delta [Erysipelotrichales bacterium]
MVIRSMTDVAFELLGKKKKAITFKKLWEEVVEVMGYSEAVAANKLATFYANLSLDARFALVEDGKWDLRSRRTFNETHKDLSDILDLDDDEDEFLDEDSENDLDEGENDEKEVFPSNLSDDDDY